jgi:hypothetical protein
MEIDLMLEMPREIGALNDLTKVKIDSKRRITERRDIISKSNSENLLAK